MNKLIKRIYVKDCPICDQAHEIEERETLIQAKIKGEIITYKNIIIVKMQTQMSVNLSLLKWLIKIC